MAASKGGLSMFDQHPLSSRRGGILIGYSRKDEDQADAEGLQNMVAAGYNPQGMLDLFRTLLTAAGNGEGPAFLADHPLTKDRIRRTQERIQRLGISNFR